MLLIFIGIVTVLVFLLRNYFNGKYSYWKKWGINGPTPVPVAGNFSSVMLGKLSVDHCLEKFYNEFPNEKVVGLYRGFDPVLLIRDPELIKHVLIKDFSLFQDRGFHIDIDKFNGKNLFMMEGNYWKALRPKITPVFTSGKLKSMYPLVQNCIDKFVKYTEHLIEKGKDHEIRELAAKYSLEVIGSCAFGLNLNSLTDEETEFEKIAKNIFDQSFWVRFWIVLDLLIPGIRNIFFKSSTKDRIKEFFLSLVNQISSERQGKPSSRKDFMDFMIELKNQGKLTREKEDGQKYEMKIDDEVIAAQAFIFYAGGFETSSSTMSFLFYELAMNPDIQEDIYQEVCEVYNKYDGQIPFEALTEFRKLEMAFDAALRKYPIVGHLIRKAEVDYTFPGTNINVKKDTKIFISVNGLHNDKKYFSDPEKFDPELFLPENKNSIPSNVYIPFGEGPRNCIGLRFAKVQSIFGTAAFIKNFKLSVYEKTTKKFTYNPKSFNLAPIGGIYLKISKR